MPTGVQFRDAAVAQRGKPYWNKDYRRLGPDMFDCSGLMNWAGRQVGILIPTTSWMIARFCHDAGTFCSVEEALHTAGSFLFKGDRMGLDGYGDGGHVASPIGDGQNIIEAKGTLWGVLIDDYRAGTHPWSGAAKNPLLTYEEDDVTPEQLQAALAIHRAQIKSDTTAIVRKVLAEDGPNVVDTVLEKRLGYHLGGYVDGKTIEPFSLVTFFRKMAGQSKRPE